MPHRRKLGWRHQIIAISYYDQTGWLTVISLFMPLILCVTVVASVGIGVITAYAAVIGILEACGRASQPLAEGRRRLLLVPTQNHASGD